MLLTAILSLVLLFHGYQAVPLTDFDRIIRLPFELRLLIFEESTRVSDLRGLSQLLPKSAPLLEAVESIHVDNETLFKSIIPWLSSEIREITSETCHDPDLFVTFPKVRRLALKYCPNLFPWSELSSRPLSHLAVTMSSLTDQHLFVLLSSGMHNSLVSLNLTANHLTDNALTILTSFTWPKLETLILSENRIHLLNRIVLAPSMPRLRRLEIKTFGMQENAVNRFFQLNAFPMLEHLAVNVAVQSVSTLTWCTRLKHLDLSWSHLSINDLRALSLTFHWQQLEVLDLSHVKINHTFADFLFQNPALWPRLKRFDFSESNLVLLNPPNPLMWPELIDLRMSHVQFAGILMPFLVEHAMWPKLRYLDVSCAGRCGHALFQATHWQDLHTLIAKRSLPFRSISPIQGSFPKLKFLDLSHNVMNLPQSHFMDLLRLSFPALTELKLSSVKMTDEMLLLLLKVQHWPKLHSLFVDRNMIHSKPPMSTALPLRNQLQTLNLELNPCQKESSFISFLQCFS